MTEAKRFLPASTSLARPWTIVGAGRNLDGQEGFDKSLNTMMGTSSPGSVEVILSHRHSPVETENLH